jgi:hypothetical protein
MKNDISNASKRALALSKRDQIIESFKRQKDHLIKVDQNGPNTNDEIDLVQMCVKFVIGEICLSECEQAEIEEKLLNKEKHND